MFPQPTITTRQIHFKLVRNTTLQKADELLGALSHLCDTHGRFYLTNGKLIDLHQLVNRATLVRDQLITARHISEVRLFREFVINPEKLLD